MESNINERNSIMDGSKTETAGNRTEKPQSCQCCMEDRKSCHIQTADIVKKLHADLRKKYKACVGNANGLWKDHCKDQARLSAYASAMHHLATDHWTLRDKTRIEWCHITCLEYFYGGGLENVLEKDQRRLIHRKKQGIMHEMNDSESKLGESPCNQGHGSSKTYETLFPQFEGKIRLLDVGSCYNPFKAFVEFMVVGIDISPAIDSVISCDFLSLEINNTSEYSVTDQFIMDLKGPLTDIPSNCFHVVVFSLLLEYLPSQEQRWLCCEKANKLLMFNGILLIITPDSHAQHRNAPMMKSWKKVIENIGFERWKYSKEEHIHCMAFRKVKRNDSEVNCDITSDMLYIPQDFNEKEEDSCEKQNVYSQENPSETLQIFNELPLDFDEL